MRKVTEYKLVNAASVPQSLRQGWQPWGSAFIEPQTAATYQPMVKYEDLGLSDHPNMPVGTDDHWAEHARYTRTDWRKEVAENNTQRGYWSWVRARLEEETDDVQTR